MTTCLARLSCVVLLFLALAVRASVAEGQSAEAQAMTYLQGLWRSSMAPGISATVEVRGRIVFSEGVGFADLDNLVTATGTTVYNVGSVSKAITAVAIMQLIEQGKVSLDDPIRKYVPTFPDKGTPISIRHIMTHTSGIRHYRPTDFPGTADEENMLPVASLEERIKVFKNDPLLFVPGKYYSYSSYAVNLLQGVVEKTSGMAFEDYMRGQVWSSAGMLSTAFDIPARIVPHRAKAYRVENGRTSTNPYGDVTYKFAGGGMISTAEDLVRLGAALNRGALLKSETIALMYKPVEPVLQYQEKGPPQKLEFEQGMIWRIFKDKAGRTFVNHCGSVKGFNACLVNYPDEDVAVAILGNGGSVTPARTATIDLAQFFLASVASALKP